MWTLIVGVEYAVTAAALADFAMRRRRWPRGMSRWAWCLAISGFVISLIVVFRVGSVYRFYSGGKGGREYGAYLVLFAGACGLVGTAVAVSSGPVLFGTDRASTSNHVDASEQGEPA